MSVSAALVPYREALAFVLSKVSPVVPQRVPLQEALGKTLGERIAAAGPVPRQALAARRGIAVSSRDLVGASPYSPAFMTEPPVRVMPGDALPPHTDAVIEEQAATALNGVHEIGQGAYPGEGAVLSGFDAEPEAEIAASGTTVTPAMLLALAQIGADSVAIRSPCVELHNPDASAVAETTWLRQTLREAGCDIATGDTADVRIVICRDPSSIELPGSVSTIAGVALNPGRDIRILWDGARLTFVFPARFDASAAGYFMLIAPLLAAMTNRRMRLVERPLTAKIVSQVGLTDVALLRTTAHGYGPLAVGALSLHALAHADAVGILHAESEGAPSGAMCAATPLKDAYEPS